MPRHPNVLPYTKFSNDIITNEINNSYLKLNNNYINLNEKQFYSGCKKA